MTRASWRTQPPSEENIQKEPREKTEKRIKSTLEHGHHSVYGHEYIKFNIENIPKVLAMVINNEKEYTTSEKSGRYTRVFIRGKMIEEEEILIRIIEIERLIKK